MDVPAWSWGIVGTYAGRLVAVAGDVLVLAGAEGPWAFFRYRDDRLTPIGEIRPDSFKVFEHFVNNDRLFLVGRGAGEEVLTVEPIWDPLPEATPDHVAPFSYGESWLGVHGFPSAADGWRGTREYSRVVAQTLADQGICLVTEIAGAEPTTVVLWYRDRTRSVSLATIPDRCIDPDARRGLLSIDGAHFGAEESVANVQHVVEPIWEYAIARVTEGGDEHGDGVSAVGRITNIVRVRTL